MRNRQQVFQVNGRLPENVRFDGQKFHVSTRVPALLPNDLIEAVRQKSQDVHREDRKTPRDLPMSRRMRCGECGSIISTHRETKTGVVYVQHHTKMKGAGCFTGTPRYQPIEDAVFHEISDWVREGGEQRAVAAVREALEAEASARPEREQQLKEAKRERSEVDKQENTLVENMKTLILKPGSSQAAKMQAAFDGIAKRREELDSKIAGLEPHQKLVDLPPDLGERMKTTLAALVGRRTTAMRGWPQDKKREVIEFLMGRGSLKGRKADGTLRHPAGIFLRWLEPGSQLRCWVEFGERGQHRRETLILEKRTLVFEARGWFGIFSGTSSRDNDAVFNTYSMNYERASLPPAQLAELAVLAAEVSKTGGIAYTQTRGHSRAKW